MKLHPRYLAPAVLALLLAACGGADGLSEEPPSDTPVARSEPPSAPAELRLAYDTKTLQFSWPAPEGATRFEVFQDPDGPDGPLVAALVATTIEPALPYAVALKARFEPNATYAVRACHDADCSAFSAPVRPDLAATLGFLKRHQAAEYEGLGSAVALSGDGRTLVVGAPYDNHGAAGVTSDPTADLGPESLNTAGAVVVFARTGVTGSWRQQAVIKPLNPGEQAAFGSSVAVSADGNTVAVGAPYENTSASGVTQGAAGPVNTLAMRSGAAYVFTRSGETWAEQAYVKADTAVAENNFAISVALSGDGNTLAVGSPGDDRIVDEGGAVFLFARALGAWSQSAVLASSNPEQYDRFGDVVALSADGATLAATATRESGGATAPLAGSVDETLANNSATESGAVYVFARSAPGSWPQQAYVKGSRSAESVGFGASISLSADGATMAIGARSDDRPERDTLPTDPNADYGAAYVFTRAGVTWTEQAYLKPTVPQLKSEFGTRLSLSANGETLAVGSPYDSSAATGLNGNEADHSVDGVGAVHLYQRASGAWARRAYIKAAVASEWLSFGFDVALSGDGAVLAVGSQGDSAPDLQNRSVPKPYSGAVYLY
ncbi:MAG TPA: integrin [Ramlibacter sp.]|nr:integrin [Ramlibacter sp.]